MIQTLDTVICQKNLFSEYDLHQVDCERPNKKSIKVKEEAFCGSFNKLHCLTVTNNVYVTNGVVSRWRMSMPSVLNKKWQTLKTITNALLERRVHLV